MTGTYEVTDIEWDTDGEEVEGLPASVTIEIDEDDIDPDDEESSVVDAVSDEHGWCIDDCKVRRVS